MLFHFSLGALDYHVFRDLESMLVNMTKINLASKWLNINIEEVKREMISLFNS